MERIWLPGPSLLPLPGQVSEEEPIVEEESGEPVNTETTSIPDC